MAMYFVFALNFLNGIVVQASRVVLALYALNLGAQPMTIGVLAAAFSLFPMLLSVPAGRMVDRFGARWPIGFGVAMGGLGLLLPWHVAGIGFIFTAAVMMGMATAICNVSLQNLAGLLSAHDKRAQNFSNFSLVSSVNNFGGPMFAGFSIDHSSHATACLGLALVSLLTVAAIVAFGSVLPKGSAHAKHAAGGSILGTLSVPGVRRTLATGSLLNTAESLFLYYLPVHAHGIGLSASVIGTVLAMNAAASFVVRTVLPRIIVRYGEEKVLACAFFVGGACIALIPFTHFAPLLGTLAFIFGLGMGCGGPIVTMQMFTNSLPGRSGEAVGLKITVNHLTKVVGPVVFGAVASAFGLPMVFWLDAMMMGVGGVMSRPRRS